MRGSARREGKRHGRESVSSEEVDVAGGELIDGREAVLSLVAMKEALEYPMSPLLEA